MPAIAPADQLTTTPPAVKEQRISKRMRQAINLLATGTTTTQRAAAERVGITETHLSRMLARPQIQALIAHESRKTIATATLRASRRLVELIDAESEHVAAKVSDRILTSEGILKSDQASVSVNVDIRAGYVIDLSGQSPPASAALNSGPVVEHDESSS